MSSIAGIYGKLPHNVKIADLVHDISGKMIRGGGSFSLFFRASLS